MKKTQKDLAGQRFGRLVVVKRVEDYVSPKGSHISRWECKCDCGKIKRVNSSDLTNGKTLSCGCLLKEKTALMGNANKQYNKYDLTGEYGIGYTNKGKEFYFDLEDYDKIKNYCWSINRQGYLRANDLTGENSCVFMHQLLLPVDKNSMVDHINRKKNDNRKSNLRSCDFSENSRNKNLLPCNKTGIIGVSKNKNKWRAYISHRNKQIALGSFCSKDEAIKARLKAEKEYFGEFAPQRHLFKEYGIE